MSEATVVDSRLTDEQVEALRAKYYTMWQTFHEGEDGRVFDALTELLALRASATAKDEHASAMRKAIVQAVEVIQVWHNMGMSGKVASDAWDIYWRNAPEMKPIREALKEA